MTLEESIKNLNKLLNLCDFTDEFGDRIDCEPYYEAVEVAIKALEDKGYEQGCDDCISREAAIDALRDAENHAFNSYYKGLIAAHKIIANLPSVTLTPKPKTGKWIEEDVFDGELVYRCSKCGEPFWLESGTPKDNEYNFCPKCGAKMESEDKE